MNAPSSRLRFLRPCAPLLAGLSLAGCGGIKDSLRFDNRLLVKVPGEAPLGPAVAAAEKSAQGWRFRHVVEGPLGRSPWIPRGQWYMAWREGDPGERRLSMPGAGWRYAHASAPGLMNAALEAFKAYPTMIEPNHAFIRAAARSDLKPPTPSAGALPAVPEAVELKYGAMPSSAWPIPKDRAGRIRPAWHLDDDYSELRRAARRVASLRSSAPPVRIGFLDNGFSAQHDGLPEAGRIEDNPYGDALGMMDRRQGAAWLEAPGEVGSSHGTGTLGLLAGRNVKIPEQTTGGRTIAAFEGPLGGAPRATIVPVRVAPWVISITTGSLAYGIDYASRVKQCDVLSLSHGGSPSQVWADAVNAAYERGTAMFAAEGDFISILFEPIQPRGIIVPSSPVYPAAFRRVMGVTGVASDGRSYAANSLGRLVRNPLAFTQWFMRGSYGPDGSWRTPFGRNEDSDPITRGRLGSLRAQPIAGYTPNVPWLRASAKPGDPDNVVDLNGSGTSASTPQVAAAAALWLDHHRAQIGSRWRSWEKAEATYVALLRAAHRPGGQPWPDRYLGAGMLKADRALSFDFRAVQALGKNPLRNPDGSLALKYALAPRDFYDGSRSISSLFGLSTDVEVNKRADLDETSPPSGERSRALARLYYNMLLLQEWHAGRLPDGRITLPNLRINAGLMNRARELASRQLEAEDRAPLAATRR